MAYSQNVNMDDAIRLGGYWMGGQWVPVSAPAAEADSAQFGGMDEAAQPSESTMITNLGEGEDWYAKAAADYNDNPLSARGADGGPAYRQSNMPTYTGNTGGGGSMTGAAGSSYSMGGAGPVSGGSSARQINDAAHQAALSGGTGGGYGGYGSSGPGTPIPGGSTVTTVGANPDVSQMAQPYLGGPPDPTKANALSGAMPSKMYDLYSSFVQDPSSMTANPMYKQMMEAGLQAAQRGAAARGFSGSGNMLTELQDRGTGIAAQFLPQMANMYQGGAQTEANRWGMENQGKLAGATAGLDAWRAGAADQLLRASANYGANKDLGAQAQAMQEKAKTMNQLRLGYM